MRFISLLPPDNQFHKNIDTLVLQDVNSGDYFFYTVDPSLKETNADILSQIKELKSGEKYLFYTSDSLAKFVYVYSVSPSK
jgi:hypothetical protein